MKSNLGYLLRSNRGFFSRAEAVDSGETDRTLATARREGLIVRLRRGMYAPADLYNASDDAGRHLLHARAALAAQREVLRLPARRPRRCTASRSIKKISPLFTWYDLTVDVHTTRRRSTIMS
jgi:putative AbiEi antitoxin of type IV toxin-antitoxin system